MKIFCLRTSVSDNKPLLLGMPFAWLNCSNISLKRGILCRRFKCVCTSSWVLWLLAAHDVDLNLRHKIHPGEIPVAVGIVHPMHSSLLPLCRTHQRARSGAQIRRVRLRCQDYGWHTIKGGRSVCLIRKVLVIRGPGRFLDCLLPYRPIKAECFQNNVCIFAVTPRFGDQSMAATWLKELQGSRTVGRCQSSIPWRATWGRDDERLHLSWTRMKPSAPSLHSQGTLVYTEQVFYPSLITVSGDKNITKTQRVHNLTTVLQL